MAPARLRLVDHRGEACGLGFERGDLAVDSVSGVEDQRATFLGILGGLEPFAIALPGKLVFEELADLGQREPGVVAQALDEAQPLEVAGVVEAIRAVRATGRLEQADLLVVADRPGRQAGIGGDFLDPQQRCGRGQSHLPHIVTQP